HNTLQINADGFSSGSQDTMTMVQKRDADDPDRRRGLIFASARTWNTVEGKVLRDSKRRSVCASAMLSFAAEVFPPLRKLVKRIQYLIEGCLCHSYVKKAEIQKKDTPVLVIKFKGVTVLALAVLIVLSLKIHEW